MTGYQIFLAYIALGAGIIIALTLIVLVVVLWRRDKSLYKQYRADAKGYYDLYVDYAKRITDDNKKVHNEYTIKTDAQTALMENTSQRLTKFEKQQTDENAAIYNAFKGNHNETLTKIDAINKKVFEIECSVLLVEQTVSNLPEVVKFKKEVVKELVTKGEVILKHKPSKSAPKKVAKKKK